MGNAQGSSLQISGFSNAEDLVAAVCAEYGKNPAQAERIIREVERLNQPLAKNLMGTDNVCFQVSYGITANPNVALEAKRYVITRRAGDNYASIVQYDDHDALARGTKYAKKRARLSLEIFEELMGHINGKVWDLPKLSNEGVDLYESEVGLFVRVGDKTWSNAPEGCSIHADADDEDDHVDPPNASQKLEFGGCVSMVEQCIGSLDESDWISQGVVKGNNCPLGGLSALGGAGQFGGGGGTPAQEEFILESSNSSESKEKQYNSTITGTASTNASENDYKEKAGDVPFDENFVDDDWD